MTAVGATSGRFYSLGLKLAEAGEGVSYFVANHPGQLGKVFHDAV